MSFCGPLVLPLIPVAIGVTAAAAPIIARIDRSIARILMQRELAIHNNDVLVGIVEVLRDHVAGRKSHGRHSKSP